MRADVRAALRRLEREAAIWREEPIKRVAVRNRLIHPLRARRFAAFGDNSFVDRPTWIYGPQKITVGDAVAARFACTISAAESITVEEHVGMGANVTIIDSSHTWGPDHPSALYGPLQTGPIRVGRGTWLADRAMVAAGTDIGEQCAIAANSVVTGTVPDYSIVVGNPGRVVGTTRT